MKTMILALLSLVAVYFAFATTVISWRPLRITIERPGYAIGMILIITGSLIVYISGQHRGEENILKEIDEIRNESVIGENHER